MLVSKLVHHKESRVRLATLLGLKNAVSLDFCLDVTTADHTVERVAKIKCDDLSVSASL